MKLKMRIDEAAGKYANYRDRKLLPADDYSAFISGAMWVLTHELDCLVDDKITILMVDEDKKTDE